MSWLTELSAGSVGAAISLSPGWQPQAGPSAPNTRFRDRLQGHGPLQLKGHGAQHSQAAVPLLHKLGPLMSLCSADILEKMPGVCLKALLLPSNQISRINVWD